jgi:hypothetical protein
MNCLTTHVVRALSLVAAIGITTLMVWLHAADLASLGARDIAVSGASTIAHETVGAQPSAQVTLARGNAF